MAFQISPLDRKELAPLLALDDAALARVGARWETADRKPGFPCRVSLADAEIGERVLLLRSRLLSVRAYDAGDMMVDADVVDGRELEGVIHRLLGTERVRYLHVHFARPGCYACRVDRA